MIGPVTEINLLLENIEPLQIYNGSFDVDTVDNQTVNVAALVRDFEGFPIIPGSSLKGALRAIGTMAGLTGIAELFGPGEISDPNQAQAGRLICWSATASRQDTERRSVKETRVSLHHETGTHADHKLFRGEIIAPGTQFEWSMSLGSVRDQAIQTLQALLRQICATNGGIVLGGKRGTGRGLCVGDLRSLSVIERALSADGSPVEADRTQVWQSEITTAPKIENQSQIARQITLTCPGLFISVDSDRKPPSGSGAPIEALREPGLPNRAALTGASLRGALRARSHWLERLSEPGARDNRELVFKFSSQSDADLTQPSAICSRLALLSATEVLFGVNGWRGLLQIRNLAATQDNAWTIVHSVKLDRFSNAPISGGLYNVNAAEGCRFHCTLALDSRGGEDIEQKVQAQFKRLCDSISQQGLELGHGTNRGYGWFNVELD